MAKQYVSMENLRFLLYEVHGAEDLFAYRRFADFDRESADMMIDAAKELADKELFPYFKEMDEKPVYYENGKVISHPQLKNIVTKAAEGGWMAATADERHGGMQTPEMIYSAAMHIFKAANNGSQGYIGLTVGASRLITSFGDQALIDAYLPKMFAGKWQGTMALTEPHAGSSLSDIKTFAEPREDGSYNIKGQKIFISAGDHQACENFVHLTLVRIKDAPDGTKGVSLFVIPKLRPTADGGLEDNDVRTAGDFQKMGQRGYATTHLVFGDNDNCRGYLVGQANNGLSYMFQMMNDARISVGMAAASVAHAAYYASLEYAKERPQGKRLGANGGGERQTLIINHPDVRRMLLAQKAIAEGSISLAFECTRLSDLCRVTEGEERENYHLLLELLTPIIKTYPSEAGIRSVSHAVQVFGGYGYTVDYPAEQYFRDMRIMAIYEGTTGIQSLDLLGRKATIANGKAVKLLFAEFYKTMAAAKAFENLAPYADNFKKACDRFQDVLRRLVGFAKKGDVENFLADATVFMELAGITVVAWQWLKQATVAQNALSARSVQNAQRAFYESKIHTMKFYFKYELPQTVGLAETLKSDEALTVTHPDKEMII